jgi:hypothetical protein
VFIIACTEAASGLLDLYGHGWKWRRLHILFVTQHFVVMFESIDLLRHVLWSAVTTLLCDLSVTQDVMLCS